MIAVCHRGIWRFGRWDKDRVGVWFTASNGEDYWFNMATFDAYAFEE